MLKTNISPTQEEGEATDDEKFLRKLKRDYSLLQMSICGILALVILIAALLSQPSHGGAFSIFENFFLSVSADNVTVTEIYELENGNIFVTLESNRDVSNSSLPTDRFPKGKEYESCENAWSEVSFYQSFLGAHDLKELRKNSYVFARETINYLNNKRVVHKRSALYYRGKFNTKKVIWEEGQKLTAAPGEIETLVQENYNEIYQDNVDAEPHIAPAQKNVDMYITDFRLREQEINAK